MFRKVLARIRVVLTAAPTYLTALAVILTIFADEITELLPEGPAGQLSDWVVIVTGWLTAAVNIIRRVTPVIPDERGLLEKGGIGAKNAAILGLAAGAVALGGLVIFAAGNPAPDVNQRLCDLEADAGFTLYDECVDPTTTTSSTTTSTTIAPTTTTLPPTTTTTLAPTTTTVPPTTTTTDPTAFVIPPTNPYPPRGSGIGLKNDGGYEFSLVNAEKGLLWWAASYWGAGGLDYAYGTGGFWADGDRQGYACGYGHLLTPGEIVWGRFRAAQAVPEANDGATYAKVNDSYMDEAQRYLDGTLVGPENGGGNEISGEDCFAGHPLLDYQEVCDTTTGDERPRIGFFTEDGTILDVRDYTNTASMEVRFQLAHYEPGEVAIVLSCDTVTNEAAITFEYSALGTGQVYVDFNGTGPFG